MEKLHDIMLVNEILEIVNYKADQNERNKLIKQFISEIFELGIKANPIIREAFKRKPNYETQLFLLQHLFFEESNKHLRQHIIWVMENLQDDDFTRKMMELVKRKGSVMASTRTFQNLDDKSITIVLRDD